MKITVKRVAPIAVTLLLQSIQRSAVIFVVTIIGMSVLLTTVAQLPISQVQPIALAISIAASFLFLCSKGIESVLQARGTWLELSKKQLSGELSGFSSSTFSVPLKKIATLHVHQTFVDKLFGICAVVFTQMNTSVSLYGFEFSDAQKFVRQFSEYQSTK